MAAPKGMILEMVGQELEKNIDQLVFDKSVPELEPLDKDNIDIAM